MCFALDKVLPFSSLIDNGRFENFESAFALGVQFCANSEGNGEHRALGVADRGAIDDRHIERAENLRADFGNDWAAAGGRITVREVAEEYSRDFFKNTSLVQMAERAVNLIRFH